MRLTVRLVFAGLMLVAAAWGQAAAQTSAQGSAPVPAQTPAQNPFDAFQHFSAAVSGGPLHWDKMKIYRSGNKMRADHDYEKEIRISDVSKQTGWFVRHWENRPEKCGPTDKMDIGTYPFFAYTDKDFKVERSPTIEKETVNGHSCTVENYTFRPKDGRSLFVKIKLWEAEDLKGFPIQMDIEPSAMPKFTLTYTDVSLDPPDPKLFRLPPCRAAVPQKKKQPASTSKPPTQASPKPPQ